MLISDFDGVLINSLDEVVLTTYNAVTGSLLTSLAALPAELIVLFKHNRFHVQQIGDAISLMKWCISNYETVSAKILTRTEYQAICDDTTVSLPDRTRQIYETRSLLINRNTKSWIALHKPFQPIWNKLVRHRNHSYVILTNKNHDATWRLCRHFGLNIKETDVYTGDHAITKAENMQIIQDRFRGESLFFIDDSVKNLQELDIVFNQNKSILTLLFASWGYTGPEDEKIALDSGYPILKQTDLILLLNKQRSLS